jgi:hypothetical protein
VLQVRSRKLDESLKEIALLGFASCSVPQAFENLVGFPPVAKVVEIDTVGVLTGALPIIR